MNAKDDPQPKGAPQEPSATVGGNDAGTAKRSGRVAYDSRGNPIWEWQLETGVYSRDVSTQRLKKLDLGELSIADTAIQKRPAGLSDANAGTSAKPGANPGGGFNPYDSASKASSGFNPYDNARATGAKWNPPPEVRRAKTPDELRKLDAIIKAQRNAKQKD